MSGGHQVTNGDAAVTNGSAGLRAVFLAHSSRGLGPLAAVDASGGVVIADPAMAEVLAGPEGDDGVASLVARLAVALGDGPAITVRPVHRGGTVRGALVGTVDAPRPEASSMTRLVGLHAGHSLLLAPGEVRLAEADGPTVWLSTERGRLRCAERGLTRLEERLHDHGFLRVHRHYLVNLRRVREIAPTFRGGMVLVLDGPDRPAVPVSRRRIAEVRAQLCL